MLRHATTRCFSFVGACQGHEATGDPRMVVWHVSTRPDSSSRVERCCLGDADSGASGLQSLVLAVGDFAVDHQLVAVHRELLVRRGPACVPEAEGNEESHDPSESERCDSGPEGDRGDHAEGIGLEQKSPQSCACEHRLHLGGQLRVGRVGPGGGTHRCVDAFVRHLREVVGDEVVGVGLGLGSGGQGFPAYWSR